MEGFGKTIEQQNRQYVQQLHEDTHQEEHEAEAEEEEEGEIHNTNQKKNMVL